MTTRMWTIKEAPTFEIERTLGCWVLWGPCEDLDEECILCGGCGSKILEFCGMDSLGMPKDQDMIQRVTGLSKWTPIRIQ